MKPVEVGAAAEMAWQSQVDQPDEDMRAQIADFGAGCARQAAEIIEALAQHLYGESEAARLAVDSGFFEVDGAQLALRYVPEGAQVEFFCDIGCPDPHYECKAYRKLLEMNLCRTYPGITFGLHPESGRMVATLSVHAFALTELDTALMLLHRLVACVGDVLQAQDVLLT